MSASLMDSCPCATDTWKAQQHNRNRIRAGQAFKDLDVQGPSAYDFFTLRLVILLQMHVC